MKVDLNTANHVLRAGFTRPGAPETRPIVARPKTRLPIGVHRPTTRPIIGADGDPLPIGIGVHGPGSAPGETVSVPPPQMDPIRTNPATTTIQNAIPLTPQFVSTSDDAAREAIGQLQDALMQAQQDHSDQQKQLQAQIDQLTAALQNQHVKHAAIVQWLIDEWHKLAAHLHRQSASAQGVTPPSQQTVNGYSRFR